MFRQSSPPQNREAILDDRIRQAITHSDAVWDREAGIAFITQIRNSILATGKPLYHFETFESLRPHIEAAKLPRKREIEDALDVGWSSSNHQRFASGDDMVLKIFRAEGHADPTQSDTFTSIINTLGKEHGWPLNANGNARKQDAAVARLKAEILSGGETVQGKPVWPRYERQYGKVRWHDASLLDSLNYEQLRVIAQEVSNLRRHMSEDRESQRERLQKSADAARGHQVFHEGDTTELDGEVRYKQNSPNNAFEFVGEHQQARPTANPTMDRSVPVPAEESVRVLFVNPKTGDYYTKKQLLKLYESNKPLWKKMMSVDVNFMNYLLNTATWQREGL